MASDNDDDNANRSSPLFMSPNLDDQVNRESSDEQQVNLGDVSRLGSPLFRPPHEIGHPQARDAAKSPTPVTTLGAKSATEGASNTKGRKVATTTQSQQEPEKQSSGQAKPRAGADLKLQTSLAFNTNPPRVAGKRKQEEPSPSIDAQQKQAKRVRRSVDTQPQSLVSTGDQNSNGESSDGESSSSASPAPQRPKPFSPFLFQAPRASQPPRASLVPTHAPHASSRMPAPAARPSPEKPTPAPSSKLGSASPDSEVRQTNPTSPAPTKTDEIRERLPQQSAITAVPPAPSRVPSSSPPNPKNVNQTETKTPKPEPGSWNGVHARPDALPQEYNWCSDDGSDIIVASPKTIMANRAARKAAAEAEKKKSTASKSANASEKREQTETAKKQSTASKSTPMSEKRPQTEAVEKQSTATKSANTPEKREQTPSDVRQSIETSTARLSAAIARMRARDASSGHAPAAPLASYAPAPARASFSSAPAQASSSPAPVPTMALPRKMPPPLAPKGPPPQPKPRHVQPTTGKPSAMSILGQAFTHLDNVANSLRDFEHQACQREEQLAEMLEEARDIRKQVVEWRANGLLGIRDRKRELRHLESLGEAGMRTVDGWVDTLRPLTLGSPMVSKKEFQRIMKDNREGKNIVAAREDGYESDSREAAQTEIAEDRVATK